MLKSQAFTTCPARGCHCFILAVLGDKPKALSVLGKASTTEPYRQPQRKSYMLGQRGVAPAFCAMFCGLEGNQTSGALRFCVLCVSIVPEADIAGQSQQGGGWGPPPCQNVTGGFYSLWGIPWRYLRESQAEGVAVVNTDVAQH